MSKVWDPIKDGLPSNVTEDEVLAAVEESMFGMSDYGFCIACGSEAWNIEPDARRYPCEGCGERAVFGAEAILLSL